MQHAVDRSTTEVSGLLQNLDLRIWQVLNRLTINCIWKQESYGLTVYSAPHGLTELINDQQICPLY